MHTTRKSLRNERLDNIEPAQKRSKLDLIKIAIFLLTLLGVLLALLGYGYILGIGFSFGYGPLELVNTSSDFIYNATVPLIKISTLFFKWDFWRDSLISNYFSRLVIISTVCWLLVYVFVRFVRSNPKRRRATREWIESAEKSNGFMDKAIFADGPVKGFVRVLITTSFYFYLGTLIMFLSAFFVLNVIFMVPMLGYKEGEKIAKEVKSAVGCVPYDVENSESWVNKKDKHAKPKAQCVKVMQDGKEIVRGRVIATNSQRILLYVRETREDGIAVRIPKSYPIRNAVIERVDTEELPLEERKSL